MDALKSLLNQKKRQLDEIAIESKGSKIIKMSDVYKKKEDEENARLQKNGTTVEVEEEQKSDINENDSSTSEQIEEKPQDEFPYLKVKQEINEEKEENLDVPVPEIANEKSWDEIMIDCHQLEKNVEPERDCDIIHSFLNHILKRWGNQLNEREESAKRSPAEKLKARTYKQTVEDLKPLMKQLKSNSCNNDMRGHLAHIVRLCVTEQDYIQANNAYMEMAIGNAPWPVGVTRSGVHQRPGSAKAYVSNIAHVLNDETQRRYIHGIKRIITKCQEYYPTDPSKCVEYVKNKQ